MAEYLFHSCKCFGGQSTPKIKCFHWRLCFDTFYGLVSSCPHSLLSTMSPMMHHGQTLHEVQSLISNMVHSGKCSRAIESSSKATRKHEACALQLLCTSRAPFQTNIWGFDFIVKKHVLGPNLNEVSRPSGQRQRDCFGPRAACWTFIVLG